MPIDINHPAYAAAMGLRNSGWQVPPVRLDLEQLLRNDPMLQGQFRQLGWGFEGATGAGALQQQLLPLDERYRQALIQYGGIPSRVQADDTLRQLAQDQTTAGMSTLAQRAHDYQLANAAAAGSVGARGLGRSGAYGMHAMENLHNYNVQRGIDESTLMDALEGIRQQKAAAAQSALGQAQSLTTDATNRIFGQIQTGMIANPQPTPIQLGPQSASPYPQTSPFRFTASPQPTLAGGQPGNQFQFLPGRGRAPLGGPVQPSQRQAAAPTRQPAASQPHIGGFVVPNRGRVPY